MTRSQMNMTAIEMRNAERELACLDRFARVDQCSQQTLERGRAAVDLLRARMAWLDAAPLGQCPWLAQHEEAIVQDYETARAAAMEHGLRHLVERIEVAS